MDGRLVSQIVGRDGVELAMNKQLSGVAGWRVTETDRRSMSWWRCATRMFMPRDGLNVVLTIDSAVQHIVETALADALQKHTPKSITGIVMRPRTGEILAMASLPNYDPNQPNDHHAGNAQPRHHRCHGAGLDVQNRRRLRRAEQRRRAIERHSLSASTGILRLPVTFCTTTSRSGMLTTEGDHHQIVQHRRGENRHQARRAKSLRLRVELRFRPAHGHSAAGRGRADFCIR